MFNISFCCCRHNVSNIFVQLTEGRSARDQPKQPPAKKKIFRAMYAQVGEEEQIISPPYTRTPLDASMRGRKKRKQGEDNAPVG